jgi:hypothetical protein
MRCLGWLLLLPLTISFYLVRWVVSYFAQKGGLWRFLGVLVSLIIGGVFIFVGYGFGIECYTEWRDGSYYRVTMPVLGWIFMVGGGIIAIVGSFKSLFGQE